MISEHIQTFTELSREELYSILQLRNDVFIVEQGCCYQDLDDKDAQALHLSLRDNNKIIAYARIVPEYQPGTVSFGRVLTAAEYRGRGLAKQLMDVIMELIAERFPQQKIIITAQHYLQNFYEKYLFIAQGEPFPLEGRTHILMVRS